MTETSLSVPLARRTISPYLLVTLATFLWATNILLGRVYSSQIGPFTLTASRFTIAGLLYAGLLLRRSAIDPSSWASKKLSQREWLLLGAMALTGVFGFPSLLYLSLRWTTASNAALINGTIPLVTTLLAAVLLHEQFKPGHIVGSLVSLAGVILIIGGSSLASLKGHSLNTGDLLLLLNTLLWGLYSVISRVVTRSRSALTVTAISTWLGIPLLYLAALLEWQSRPPAMSLSLVLTVVYIAVFPTCIGFFAWNEGVRSLGPSLSMAFYNLLPVFGVLLSILFLSEQITWVHLAGGFLVLSGGLWVVGGWLRNEG